MTAAPRHEVLHRLPGRVPLDRIRTVEVRRHAEALAAELLALPDISSAVADALDELGRGAVLSRGQLAPLGAGQRLTGPAVTLRYVPVDGDTTTARHRGVGRALGDRDLYGISRPGDVAVMDAGAVDGFAVVGGLSAAWARRAGLAGVVTDGAARDGDSIARSGLPVWSAGRSPRAVRYRAETIEINGPVTLADAVVCPGDYIVADEDGVCVVPHELFPHVVRHCVDAQLAEDDLLETIASATSLEDLVARTDGSTPD